MAAAYALLLCLLQIRKRQEEYAAQVASLLGPVSSHDQPPAKRRRSELV